MIDERVLLATALVHARRGGHLVVTGPSGHRVVIGRQSGAEISPCRWRSALIRMGADRFDAGTPCRRVELHSVGGSLESARAGGFVDHDDPMRRWFATRLSPDVVTDVLRSVELGGVPEHLVSAKLRPDASLGVTVIGLAVSHGVGGDHGAISDRLAGDVAAALAVAELYASLPVRGR